MDVVVATFGGPEWAQLARQRAFPSAIGQADNVFLAHSATLARARNAGLEQVESDFVVFLDADDELEPGYLDAMESAAGDMRAPRVRYVSGNFERLPAYPVVPGHRHDCETACLEDGNFLVIGTAIRTELAREVGGFREEPIYEDWSLFLRCARAGGTVERVPDAIYRAHVRDDSRNRSPAMEWKNAWHRRIHAEEGPLAA